MGFQSSSRWQIRAGAFVSAKFKDKISHDNRLFKWDLCFCDWVFTSLWGQMRSHIMRWAWHVSEKYNHLTDVLRCKQFQMTNLISKLLKCETRLGQVFADNLGKFEKNWIFMDIPNQSIQLPPNSPRWKKRNWRKN